MPAAHAALTLLTLHRPSTATPTLPTPTAQLTSGRWSITSDSAAIPTGPIVTAGVEDPGVENPSSDSLDAEVHWQHTKGLAGIFVESTLVDATT